MFSALSLFYKEKERGRGGVYDIEFGGQNAASVVGREKLFDHFSLDRTFFVSGVYGDDQTAVALKKLNCCLDGGNGGFV